MTRLPDPPGSVAYLGQLVRAIEQELDRRATLIDGALVITEDMPLVLTGPDRRQYTVGVDTAGGLTLTPDD